MKADNASPWWRGRYDATVSDRFDVLLPLGPGETEVERARDLVAALSHYEPGPWRLTVVDDDQGNDRGLAETLGDVPGGCEVVSVTHKHDFAQRRWFVDGDGRFICGTTMTGLAAIAADVGRFVLKLDSDALVIGGFSDRVAAKLTGDVGLVGACTRTPNGTVRDISMHAGYVRRTHRPKVTHFTPGSLRQWYRDRGDPVLRPVRLAMDAALASGYQPGEHALGGALAIRGEVLTRLASRGWLDVAAWEGLDWSEDVMIGMLVKAAGFTHADAVAAGEPFGVKFQGLPMPPAELAEKGYALIHAVKNDDVPEEEIRAFFRERREGALVPA